MGDFFRAFIASINISSFKKESWILCHFYFFVKN